jgi:hypothetical protein
MMFEVCAGTAAVDAIHCTHTIVSFCWSNLKKRYHKSKK